MPIPFLPAIGALAGGYLIGRSLRSGSQRSSQPAPLPSPSGFIEPEGQQLRADLMRRYREAQFLPRGNRYLDQAGQIIGAGYSPNTYLQAAGQRALQGSLNRYLQAAGEAVLAGYQPNEFIQAASQRALSNQPSELVRAATERALQGYQPNVYLQTAGQRALQGSLNRYLQAAGERALQNRLNQFLQAAGERALAGASQPPLWQAAEAMIRERLSPGYSAVTPQEDEARYALLRQRINEEYDRQAERLAESLAQRGLLRSGLFDAAQARYVEDPRQKALAQAAMETYLAGQEATRQAQAQALQAALGLGGEQAALERSNLANLLAAGQLQAAQESQALRDLLSLGQIESGLQQQAIQNLTGLGQIEAGQQREALRDLLAVEQIRAGQEQQALQNLLSLGQFQTGQEQQALQNLLSIGQLQAGQEQQAIQNLTGLGQIEAGLQQQALQNLLGFGQYLQAIERASELAPFEVGTSLFETLYSPTQRMAFQAALSRILTDEARRAQEQSQERAAMWGGLGNLAGMALARLLFV